MDQYTQNPREPWDHNLYETGRTQPPKNRSGLIAFLLAAVIFLGGLVSVMGILNIRLFAQLRRQNKADEAVSFVSQVETTPPPAVTDTTPDVSDSTDSGTLTLNPSAQSEDNLPVEEGISLQHLYEKNIPSVVSITCSGSGSTSTGTGVILTEDGYLVTNCHVIENADAITADLTDGRSFAAQVVGADAASDLAVLRIDGTDFIPAEFGDSSALRVGDAVAAIGDPLGLTFRGTLTDGIVSAINRDLIIDGRPLTLIQTNCALNSGNSGGPLINCYGQVIGINTMKIGTFVNDANVEGLGFAIPSTTVKEIVDQLISQGYVSGRPYLGIAIQDLSSIDRLYYHLPQGVWISAVEENSDAAAKGIAPGDLLLSVDNTRITSSDALTSLLYSYEAGDTIQVVIYRSGMQYTLELTIGEAK